MTTRDDLRASKALQGMDFPATKDNLIEYAESRGADQKSLQALRTLPEKEFGNMDEVIDAVPQEPEGDDVPGGTQR
ncbi:DUF2795 domain-containing protein [Yaniella halotolerans]|uniref:DUF2795 domain-containing protein n=1 Tax=Yaniella halotolerans TaxID=225453 RepID=UPI0003B3C58B|nr:DUF2795 domain-containing protein [Yaniella halotolerans]